LDVLVRVGGLFEFAFFLFRHEHHTVTLSPATGSSHTLELGRSVSIRMGFLSLSYQSDGGAL
jgi:hypothetical protein